MSLHSDTLSRFQDKRYCSLFLMLRSSVEEKLYCLWFHPTGAGTNNLPHSSTLTITPPTWLYKLLVFYFKIEYWCKWWENLCIWCRFEIQGGSHRVMMNLWLFAHGSLYLSDRSRVRIMVFNATLNNISIILWRSERYKDLVKVKLWRKKCCTLNHKNRNNERMTWLRSLL